MRNKYIISAGVILTLIVLSSCSVLFPAEERTTPPPIVEPESFSYTTEKVKRESIAKSVRKNGRLVSLLQYNLTFEKRGGYLSELSVWPNKRVFAGEVIASIDTDDLERQIAEQILNVEAAQIDYDNAVRQVAAAKENYDRVSSVVSMLRKEAKQEIKEKRELYEEGEISESELNKAESTYKQRIAELDSQLAQASAAASTQADTKALTALKQAEMKLANLRDEYEKTVIRSPINGLITFVTDLNIGSFVEARKTVVTVVDDSQLFLMITDRSDPDSFYLDFPIGASVSVWLKGKEHSGIIAFTPADVPINSVFSDYAFLLIDVADIPYDKVSTGDVAVATINTEYRENVITVPTNAVQTYGDYSYVRVLKDGASIERPVELGLSTPTRTEIVSGLDVGELVIIR